MALSPAWISAVAGYSREQRAAGLRPDTIELRRIHLNHLARRVDADPWNLTDVELLDYVNDQDWEPATRRSRRTTLRGFYRWAVESGYRPDNPAARLPRVKPSVPVPRPIPTDVYDDVYATADARERLILRLARDAGLRRGEIARVHSRDLHEDLTGWALRVDGKGGKVRNVHLTNRLALELRTLPPGWAFPGNVDGHLSPRWVGKLVNRLMPGLWTIHTVRHRNAKEVHVALGYDLLATGKHLGHASTVTTQNYVPVDNERYERGVEAAAS